MLGMTRSLYRYKQFIYSSIRNELIHRFASSKLGGFWSILNPLSQVLIYSLILSNILHAKLPGLGNKYAYVMYLMAGLLAWNLFSDIVSRCMSLFVEQGALLKKINFPRVVLPVITIGSCVISNALLFAAMLLIFLILGHHFSLQVFWLMPLISLVVIFAVGIGLILGVLNVFIRDISQVVPIVLQVGFWFTPIVYPLSIIPERYQYLLKLNPMYPFVYSYQQVLVYNHAPDFQSVAIVSIVAGILLMMSLLLFRRAGPEMVDVI